MLPELWPLPQFEATQPGNTLRVFERGDDRLSNRGFGTVWGDAAEFATFMDKGDAQMGVAMKAAGLSKA